MNSRTLRRKPYFAGPARRLVRTSRSLPGFGAEGCVLVAMLSGIRAGARIFYLDTDLLFPETYALRDRLEARYGVRFERRATRVSLGDQAVEYGERLWERQPDLCCRVRKVEPLKEMLTGLRAWVTAIRREQAIARANIGLIERDERFGLIKINPLATWSARDVRDYHCQARCALQPASRPRLSVYWLRALHHAGANRRGHAPGPMARHEQD